jgi:lambda family phage minor tail protein L
MTVPQAITEELQKVEPSSIIELFELQLVQALHGSTDIYRFHAGVNAKNDGGNIVWAGQAYTAFPVECEGFEYSGNGQLPRPKLRVANVLGTITTVLLAVNAVTPGNDLIGAKVIRRRTLARYLDAVNFTGNVNPYGTPDPTAEFPQEIYFISRKVSENRDLVEFELAAVFDLQGVRAPKRQCISNICQWTYKSAECGYTPVNSFTGTYQQKVLSATYSRSGTTITITSASHGITAGDVVHLDFTSGAGVDGFFTVVTVPTTGAFTVTSGASGATNGDVTVRCYKVTAASHGLSVGDNVRLTPTTGAASGGSFIVGAVSAGAFSVQLSAGGGNTSGDVTASQWYTDNDLSTTSSTADVCGKRVSSCEARFGANSSLPFGSFPGVGSYTL